MAKTIHETVHEVANRKPKLHKGKATSIHVNKADDESGYIVRTHENNEEHYQPPHESVHKNLASVQKHMKDCFEGSSGPKDDDGDETNAL
jgi:hypothetical protein